MFDQPSIKTFICTGCAVTARQIRDRQHWCAKCRPARQAKEDVRRRAALAKARAGQTFACLVCETVLPRVRSDQKWCIGCAKVGLATYKRGKRRAAGMAAVGSIIACKHCGQPCIKLERPTTNCAACTVMVRRSRHAAGKASKATYDRQYVRRRRREDPAANLDGRMSSAISQALRGLKAGRKWETLVGYTLQDLMRHLERQFLKGMNWDNRAMWHIDHIVPRAAFTYTCAEDPEFRAAWTLTNLRPLWKKDNLEKSSRRTLLL